MFKSIVFITALIPALAAGAAPAIKVIQGEPAKNCIQALKLAAVKSKRSAQGAVYEYTLQSVTCHTADAYDDGLSTYNCLLNKTTQVAGAAAKILYDALVEDLHLPVDRFMSQTQVQASSMHCVIDISAAAPAYRCQWRP